MIRNLFLFRAKGFNSRIIIFLITVIGFCSLYLLIDILFLKQMDILEWGSISARKVFLFIISFYGILSMIGHAIFLYRYLHINKSLIVNLKISFSIISGFCCFCLTFILPIGINFPYWFNVYVSPGIIFILVIGWIIVGFIMSLVIFKIFYKKIVKSKIF